MNSEDILTLSELVDLYDKGEVEGEWFCFYPTDLHKENNLLGWMPRKELVAWSKLVKEFEKDREARFIQAVWGKTNKQENEL